MIRQATRIINQHTILSLALLISFFVYLRFLSFGHISWDDPEMVFRNKAVQSFDLKTLLQNHYVGNYIPVTMLVHAFGWLIFENSEWGHHLLNILLHLVNGILVYQLSRKVFSKSFIADIAVVVFLLHPLQVESVGWISELKNILSTTFFLLSFNAYVDYRNKKLVKQLVLSFLFFTAACFSKSSAVVLPLILIAFDGFHDKKLSVKLLLNKLPFLVLSVIAGLINMKSQAADMFINYSHAFPYHQRVGLAGFAILKYCQLFIAPINLSVIYPYPEINHRTLLTGFIALALILCFIFFAWKKNKIELIFITVFIILNLALVLQFVPFGEVLYADRYMYVPLIGFAWLTGIILSQIKIQALYISIALTALYGISTFSRSTAWKSAISLYEDIIKKYPDQFIALNSAGVESMFMNRDDKALEYFNRAVKSAPRNYKGYYNRGLLFLKKNKPQQAIKSFNEAIKLYEYAKAYVGRASAYYLMGDFPKAINDASHALQLEPNNVRAHFVMGNCYNDMNQLNEALREYNKCIELNNDEGEHYFKRAIVYGKKQDFKACLYDLDLALQLNSQLMEAYYWRGVAKVNLRINPCDDFRIAAQNNFQPAVAAFNNYCR